MAFTFKARDDHGAPTEPTEQLQKETMSNPLEEQDEDLFVSTIESSTNDVNPKQEELNHNILEVAEDIDLNDDETENVTLAKQNQGVVSTTSPLDQVPPAMNEIRNSATKIVPSNNNDHKPHAVSANGQPDDRFIEIKVGSASKVGDGMGAYLVYKISTKTNLGFFKKSEFAASRRFSDFLGLYEKLVERHVSAGRIVPPAPEKNVVGMTKVKIGKEELTNDEFVERRRSALERFLVRVSRHPVLVTDSDFREFLELEVDLPKSTHTSTLSGAGVIKLISKVGDTVNKITYKMDENDSWFEDKTVFIDNLDIQLRKLHASLDYMVQQRRELAANSGTFARSAAMLGNCEEHTGLSRCLSKLSELHEKVEQAQTQQANNDFYLLAELLKDYVGLVGAIKEAFHQRVKVYQMWQHAQQSLTKRREQLNRYQLASRSERIPAAKNDVEDWESKVERGEEEFRKISKIIKQEFESFEGKRIEEFKNSIVRYMECLLENQQQLAQLWETFLPEAKAIEE